MAQHNVTFQVDMTGQTIDPDGVHVAGNFQAAAGAASDWDPAATAMTQVGATDIYEVTVNIPAGDYQFKYINDNDWPGAENVPAISQVSLGKGYDGGNSNRWLSVYGDTTLPAVTFAGDAPANMENFTFLVDMSQEASVSDTVSVAGDFANPNWSPGSMVMSDFLGDSLYRYTAYVPTSDTISFKYVNGSDWGSAETVPSACNVGGNRQAVVSNDTVAGPICFGACSACFIPDTFNITIQIDMNYVCDFNDTVDIAGPFNGWPGSLDMAHMLTDADNDGVYEITVRAAEPEFEYKARFHNGGTNWEAGSNKVISFSKDTILPVRCFGNDAYVACQPVPAPSDFTVMVDLTTFPNPADLNDMYVIAGFTNPAWQGGKTLMTPVAGMPGIVEATFTDVCPGTIEYKFMNVMVDGTEQEEGFPNLQDSSCVVASGAGGFNRIFTRDDDQADTVAFKYDQCTSIIGVSTFATQALEVYPNPMSDFTNVMLPLNGNFDVKLIDMTGKEVRSRSQVNGRITISKDGLSSGIYLLNVINERGEINSSKLSIR